MERKTKNLYRTGVEKEAVSVGFLKAWSSFVSHITGRGKQWRVTGFQNDTTEHSLFHCFIEYFTYAWSRKTITLS